MNDGPAKVVFTGLIISALIVLGIFWPFAAVWLAGEVVGPPL